MNQVANQILGSLGSWDAGSILCGNDTVEKPKPAYPRVTAGQSVPHPPSHDHEDDMAVEWEGQEVQLLDRCANESDGSVASEERMPPPMPPRHGHAVPDNQSSTGVSSLAFSSLGSCHSWLPVSEQFSTAASYFGGRGEEGSLDMEGGGSILDNQSGMMMGDHSATGSIGGASLTRVFENEVLPDVPTSMMPEAPGNHRVLASMPSWERSLRSRSPLCLESDDEDVSLISKESSKISAENYYGAYPMQHQQPEANGMVWERKE